MSGACRCFPLPLTWRKVEAKLHLKQPKPKTEPKAKAAKTSAPDYEAFQRDDFVPAKSFCGYIPGWVYTAGCRGLGYYFDVPGSRNCKPVGNITVLQLANAIPVSACSAALMQLNGGLPNLAA